MSLPDGCDPMLLELFRGEMDTHLPVLDQGLLLLEKGNAGQKDFESMMRAAHSIKGAARIVGVEPAVRLSHAMEDCFSAAQAQQLTLTSDSVDILLAVVDTLQRICSPSADAPVETETIDSLIDEINALRQGRAPARKAPAAVSELPMQSLVQGAAASECRIVFPATIDAAASESLRKEFLKFVHVGLTHVRLDLSSVDSVSAAGLVLLGALATHVVRCESTLDVAVEGVSDALQPLLRTAGLDHVFRVTR